MELACGEGRTHFGSIFHYVLSLSYCRLLCTLHSPWLHECLLQTKGLLILSRAVYLSLSDNWAGFDLPTILLSLYSPPPPLLCTDILLHTEQYVVVVRVYKEKRLQCRKRSRRRAHPSDKKVKSGLAPGGGGGCLRV